MFVEVFTLGKPRIITYVFRAMSELSQSQIEYVECERERESV